MIEETMTSTKKYINSYNKNFTTKNTPLHFIVVNNDIIF